MSNYSQVIFVSGSGRSGTNITKEIFSKHSKVATLPFEYRFTIDPRGIVNFIRTYPESWSPFWPDYKIKDLIEFLTSLGEVTEEKKLKTEHAKSIDPKGIKLTAPAYSGWELEKWIPGYLSQVKALEHNLIDFSYSATWPGTKEGIENNEMFFATKPTKEELIQRFIPFLDGLAKSILNHHKKEVFLEDNTYSILFSSELLDLYPNSKLIHIIRDPRDVISSVIKQRWTPNTVEQATVWYKEIMKEWEIQKSKLSTDRFIELRFEDLIKQKDSSIKLMCQFTGLEVETDLNEVKLDHPNNGRYKEELSQNQIDYIENQLNDFMLENGYL